MIELSTNLLYMVPALVFAGLLVGLLAGTFGVGGGGIIVPVLYECFRLMGVADEVRMPLCVGTSLAIIIPTSIRSARGHLARGAVDMTILRAWVAPLLAGVLIGSLSARFAPPWVFKLVFVSVSAVLAIKLLAGRESWRLGTSLPGRVGTTAYGMLVGVISSMMGTGGGGPSTMVLTLYGVPIHRAVATSAGVGTIVALPGAVGYMIAGWPDLDLLPPLSLGYVSVLAFALVVPTTLLAAPFGVRLAHALTRRQLEVAFAVFLLVVGARFLVSLILEV
ncbi:sulfite exporter TauE/SafE family protein [Amorphus orientalis]|uniref:Probable membrane transporter protein n=1 Tax=Amorphus orientalis TaxID=649198 RepID=A0AAE3VRQ6_9HYPH|nr:sulfite exporter TauE/SafE family protein [Amorphus orientalis]MDQ0316921.1 putative membrane protein YfcA [Amorphus orientalis]